MAPSALPVDSNFQLGKGVHEALPADGMGDL